MTRTSDACSGYPPERTRTHLFRGVRLFGYLFAELLGKRSTRWKSSNYALNKFDTNLNFHREMDERSGLTCVYTHPEGSHDEGLTRSEVLAMAEHIPPEFIKGAAVNQHYEHSLEQFYAHVQKAWDDHVKRTTALIGTAAGRIG